MTARRHSGGAGLRLWRQVVIYGLLLAGGSALLAWLDYVTMVRTHWRDLYIFAIALAFLVIGIVIGTRLIARPAPFDGNPRAVDSLGITARELAVLHELAAGHSNKEIAIRLGVSPNTVKTHVARLLEKLGAKRRTDAIQRARELGLLP